MRLQGIFWVITLALAVYCTAFVSRGGKSVERPRFNNVPSLTSNYPRVVPKRSSLLYGTKQDRTKDVAVEDVIAGVGDDGCKMPSLSGVNTLPNSQQAAIVIGILVAMFVGTAIAVKGLDSIVGLLPFLQGWISTYPLLGLVYFAAGIAHFKIADDFMNIMPSYGAWGFWYLPGSKYFHVAWTGVAEVLLGGAMTLGYALSFLGSDLAPTSNQLLSNSALGLFWLTVLVTPANIYMYTHGAKLPIKGPDVRGT